LARLVGADAAAVFWVTALRNVGCTAFAPEEVRPVDLIRRVAGGFGPEAPVVERRRDPALPDRSIGPLAVLAGDPHGRHRDRVAVRVSW
jgi:hypothetical protein